MKTNMSVEHLEPLLDKFNFEKRLSFEHLAMFEPETIVAIRMVLASAHAMSKVSVLSTLKFKDEGTLNLYTEWDAASKKATREVLRKTFLQDPVLSEEADEHPNDPLNLPRLWVFDELDGSFNASRNIDYYAISVAFVQNGTPTSGAVYFPSVNKLFYAEQGKGAYLNGEPLKTLPAVRLNEAAITTNASYHADITDKHSDLGKATGTPRRHMGGSTVLSLLEVAAGSYNLGFALDTKPWDVAAAILFVREKGDKVCGADGRKTSILDSDIVVGHPDTVDAFVHVAKPLLQSWNFRPKQFS